jgi:DNA-binding NtrC family response regulator
VFENLIGESPTFTSLLRTARKVAVMNVPVLITGEAGTGKSALALALHSHGPRSRKPFVTVNCAAPSEQLAMSGVFGADAAATSELRSDEGLAAVDGGTLFLDGVEALTPSVQSKLLRFLETGAVQPAGGITKRWVDFRVISATRADLQERAARGEFRHDLFYRLNVVPLELPPLRERREDIPLLIHFFLDCFARESELPIASLSGLAQDRLVEYSWPGNLSELRDLCKRMAVLASGRILEESDLPPEMLDQLSARKPLFGLPGLNIDLRRVEINLIRQSLIHTNWVHERAARLLGISRSELASRMAKFGITSEPPY